MKQQNERKERLIKALAQYLGRDMADRSIRLQMGDAAAKEWSELYNASGIFGWKTVEEIEDELRRVFQ